MELQPNTIAVVKTVGGLTKPSKWGDKTNKHLEKLMDGLLKPKGHMTNAV